MEQSHREISEILARLGLPDPATGGTKLERVQASLASIEDADLARVAELILLEPYVLERSTRNAIQDVLWAGRETLDIPKRTRREIARALDLADLVYAPDRFMAALDEWWVLDDDPLSSFLGNNLNSLRGRIQQHVLCNPDDWSTEELFENLGAYDSGNTRFARCLEALVSAEAIPDDAAQRRAVEVMNPHLRAIGAELGETGSDGGYPVFTVVDTHTPRHSPKNLIFASPTKPDLRLSDALDNDIEILNPDDVLIYDRPIAADGLRWRELQAWWMATRELPDEWGPRSQAQGIRGVPVRRRRAERP